MVLSHLLTGLVNTTKSILRVWREKVNIIDKNSSSQREFFFDCEISLYIVHCICRLLRWFVVASVVQVYGTLLHSSLIVQVLNKFLKVAINSLVFSFVRSFTWLFQSTSDIPTYSYDNEHVWEKSLFLVARQSIRMFILCTYEWPRNSNTVSQWI